MKHLIIIFLTLFTINSQAQNCLMYNEAAALIESQQLVPHESYQLIDTKITLVAKTSTTFYERPLCRSVHALDFDDETFNFATKQITAIDEIDCVIRCTGVWSLINDVGHKPYKVATVGGNATIYFGKTYDKVIGFQASLDDTYSASPLIISCGASVGLSNAVLYIYRTAPLGSWFTRLPMTLAELSIAGSNIFISGKFSKQIQL
jgi:hypothetical protein